MKRLLSDTTTLSRHKELLAKKKRMDQCYDENVKTGDGNIEDNNDQMEFVKVLVGFHVNIQCETGSFGLGSLGSRITVLSSDTVNNTVMDQFAILRNLIMPINNNQFIIPKIRITQSLLRTTTPPNQSQSNELQKTKTILEGNELLKDILIKENCNTEEEDIFLNVEILDSIWEMRKH